MSGKVIIDKDFKNLVKFSNKLKTIKQNIEKTQKNIDSYNQSIDEQKTIKLFFFQKKKLEDKKYKLDVLHFNLYNEKCKLEDHICIMIKTQKKLDYFKKLVGRKIILKVLDFEKRRFPKEFQRFYKAKDDIFIKKQLHIFINNPKGLYIYVNDKLLELLNYENLEDLSIRNIIKECLELEIEITKILRVLNVKVSY